MLHIHNGDISAETARRAALPGQHFAFREALIEGPTPGYLSPSEFRKLRADHLAKAYDLNEQEYEDEWLAQTQTLQSFKEHDEVVLWFEHDLFCQVHLIYLLDWFRRQEMGATKLSLVCIDRFPGKENFRGLGELNAAEFASLFPARQEVTRDQMDLASACWQAYCSNDPTDLQALLETDTSALPFLAKAMQAHLRRFPSTRNGLGLVENRGLELIHSGLKRFADVFPKFGETEPIYGLGDAQFLLALRRLAEVGQPLVTLQNKTNGHELTIDSVRDTRFEITDLGEAVLKGKADFIDLNGADVWLGGVYLSGDKKIWRWDEASEALILTSA